MGGSLCGETWGVDLGGVAGMPPQSAAEVGWRPGQAVGVEGPKGCREGGCRAESAAVAG